MQGKAGCSAEKGNFGKVGRGRSFKWREEGRERKKEKAKKKEKEQKETREVGESRKTPALKERSY